MSASRSSSSQQPDTLAEANGAGRHAPAPDRCRWRRFFSSSEKKPLLCQAETLLRFHHLWTCLIGVIWGLCLSPVAAAETPAATVPVCQRTPRVRDALVRATCPRCSCKDVTFEQLASVRQLSLRQLGLRQLTSGDLSGLTSLEMLDLTGNPLKTLPDSLSSELGTLKSMKMDLSLFTRLSDAVVTPLLDRPGFNWEMSHQNRTCGPFNPHVFKKDFLPDDEQLQSVLQLPDLDGQLFIQAWSQGISIVGLKNQDNLQLFAISKDLTQKWILLAKTVQTIPLTDNFHYVFDFAPYRLSADELGFGLRRLKSDAVPYQRLAYEEQLRIFRIHEGTIQEVLKTVVYTQYDQSGPPPWVADPDNEDYLKWNWQERNCAVIAVAQSKTHDIFNWVKVQWGTTTQTSSTPDAARTPTTAVFRWTGERYETRQDPTSSVLFND